MLTKVDALCPQCGKVVTGMHRGLAMITNCPDCGNSYGYLEIDSKFLDEFGFNRHCDVLQSVLVPITDHCDVSCKLCYYPIVKDSHFNIEMVQEQCAKLSEYKIYFTGGEPTCHPYLFELVKLIPNFETMLTHGMKFSDINYCKEFLAKVGLDTHGFMRVIFSVHSNMPKKKIEALQNFRRLKLATNVGMFSITTLSEVKEAIEIWNEYKDVICHARIRTPFNSWMQRGDKKLYLSEVYKEVCRILPNFKVTDCLGGNSIFNVNLEYQNRYLSLCSSPGRDAFPINYLSCAPKMLALDGNIYSVPQTLRMNEVFDINMAIYNGAKALAS